MLTRMHAHTGHFHRQALAVQGIRGGQLTQVSGVHVAVVVVQLLLRGDL